MLHAIGVDVLEKGRGFHVGHLQDLGVLVGGKGELDEVLKAQDISGKTLGKETAQGEGDGRLVRGHGHAF